MSKMLQITESQGMHITKLFKFAEVEKIIMLNDATQDMFGSLVRFSKQKLRQLYIRVHLIIS